MRPVESVHAQNRGPVRFTIGRRTVLGTLVYWPSPDRGRRGKKATVQTAAGHYVSVAVEDVELIDPAPQEVTP